MRFPSPQRNRRGNFAIIMAISLTTLLGFGALAIDASAALNTQAQLQNAADAAAHAAVFYLDGTEEGVERARQAAIDIAAMNSTLVDGSVQLDPNYGNSPDGDIIFGFWDVDTGQFQPSDDPEDIDSVQISATAGEVAFLLPALTFTEVRSFQPAVDTTGAQVVTGAGAVDCYIPLAVSECLFDTHGMDGIMDVTLVLNPAGSDNTGWSRASTEHPNASWLGEHIMNCEQDGEVAVGEPITLDNGVKTSVLSTMVDRIEASVTDWDEALWGPLPEQHPDSGIDPDLYGKTYENPMFTFDNPDYCVGSGGNWNTTESVSGFVWGAVYDVVDKGPVEGKNVYVRLNTADSFDFGTQGGGQDFGVTHTALGLVK